MFLLTAVTFEDRLKELDEPELRLPPTSVSVEKASPWLLTDRGNRLHKTTVCVQVIMPDWVRKPHERIFRVRCYSSDTKPRDYNSGNTLSSDMFTLGDLFVTLIRCEGQAAMAILKCIAIHAKGQHTSSIQIASLAHTASGIKLTGQILDLCAESEAPCNTDDSTGDNYSEARGGAATAVTGSEARTWLWTGAFVTLAPDHSNDDSSSERSNPSFPPQPAHATLAHPGPVSRKTLAVKVGSHLCHILNPNIQDGRAKLARKDQANLNSSGLTWQFSEGDLNEIVSVVWQTVRDKGSAAQLPLLSSANQHLPPSRCVSHSNHRPDEQLGV